MKTWKILSSYNGVFTFTADDSVYTLCINNEDDECITILKAVDNDNGFKFVDDISTDMGYDDLDYMRLFLNLISKVDDTLFDSYIMLEPVAQI